MDTQECPECYFEAKITLDTWEEVKRTLTCHHFTLTHEKFTLGYNHAIRERAVNIDDNCEMVRIRPCDSVFLSESEGNHHSAPESLKPRKFLEHLDSLKRRDEIHKQKTLGREMFHRLQSHSCTLEELEAPRYISSYPLHKLYQFYGSLNRSHERARCLSEPYPELQADRLQAQLCIDDLGMNLRSTASTGTNERLLSYMCMAIVGPGRRYNKKYNSMADRVMLFKHLIASGFPIETVWNVVKTINAVKRVSMLILSLEEGIELQLRKTVQPTTYNRKIASLIWLFSYITAYCTLRQLSHEHI